MSKSLQAAFVLSLTGAMLPLQSQAQMPTAGHYPAGAEGIKAATLPPPGFYFRDYNQYYDSAHLMTGYAGAPNQDPHVHVYAQVPRLIYISELEVLGANYGCDILVPFVYTDLSTPGAYHRQSFGLGDICVEPLLLSWHFDRVDVSTGYAFWAPTGKFDMNSAAQPGKGFWGHMLTLGATAYLDSDKTWAVSLLNRYEFNTEQDQTDNTPGQDLTMEWGISKSLTPTFDVGVVGYYQVQTTRDTGNGISDSFARHSAVAVGPEINVTWPKLGVITSLRYNIEAAANERFQGHNVTLTLTKRF